MASRFSELADRAVVEVSGPDWRAWLQGLLTQDVDGLAPGEIRFGALLTPQGRLLFDLFIIGTEARCRLDCVAAQRQGLVDRLGMYRLRAKVTIEPVEVRASALWGAETAPAGWLADPRLPALGYRGYDASPPAGSEPSDYEAHRLSLGVPGPDDWGSEKTYPIEANFDLLNGIDFRKGCFVGQETTSRMKRRGTLKTRMGPIAYEGEAAPDGSELLAADLRAGETHSSAAGVAIASLRLDRLAAGDRRLPDGREWRPVLPEWMMRELA